MLSFGTKAETLERLSGQLASAQILPLHSFTADDWQERRADVLQALATRPWSSQSLIVRSSAAGEDSHDQSMAGCFLSVPNVRGRGLLIDAIDRVVASYGSAPIGSNQVLVQPMLANVALSGVAFSRDPNTGAPYLVVNAQAGADTAAVTGGHGRELRTWYIAKAGPAPREPWLARILALTDELETLFGTDALDIEFALDHGGTLHLFQVRPLVSIRRNPVGNEEHQSILADIATKLTSATGPHPFLHGRRTIFGIMPDWNPAEIVGVRPRPLALSLYREIITDSIWAYQRHNYGYRNLRSFPLLIDFHGLPYIDVRVSFNSFVPADIEPRLADRLVDHYIDCLEAAPILHDKVEFEIVLSCYTFDLPARLSGLMEKGFSYADVKTIEASLRQLTKRIIDCKTGLWREDAARIETLQQRRSAVLESGLDTVSRIYWLLEDCKRYGTLPFAGLARAGFIAVQLLKSLVAKDVLSETDADAFMAGLDTVSTTMIRDLAQLDRTAFLAKYGHLRPGTYDILSPRYDEADAQYFDWDNRKAESTASLRNFRLSLPQMRAIAALQKEHDLGDDVVGLFDFIEAGIKGREYSKFVFTRSLSDALRLIGQLGEEHGFSTEDMSFVDIHAIYQLYGSGRPVKSTLAESIARGRESYARTTSIVLPPLLASPDEVWAFEMPATEPNYITQQRVSAPVVRVADGQDLTGAIALIANADPGFDWIFSRNIKGLITAYGGVNSHMAIRASELGLPAVIGVGEALFAQWSNARVIEIDAANRQVRVLQ